MSQNDRWCYECSSDLSEGEGKIVALEFWTWDENGKEGRETREELLCEECAHEFEEPN